MKWWDQMARILVFWMLSFKQTFSLSSYTFIKRLFSSSLSTIRVVSSAYLRILIFIPAILIPACASSSLAFHMMYSAYKANKQGNNIQPWLTSFLIWNQSVFPCPVLTVASWPAYNLIIYNWKHVYFSGRGRKSEENTVKKNTKRMKKTENSDWERKYLNLGNNIAFQRL